MPKGEVVASGPEGLGTRAAEGALVRLRFSHDAMVDFIIANPAASNRIIATAFGFTEGWISRVICSDAFQARLAQRKDELVDPVITANIEERLQGLAVLSATVLEEKLEASRNPELAAKVLGMTVNALGYGARRDNIAQQNNFVVMLPEKAGNSEDWAAKARPQPARGVGGASDIVDVTPETPTVPENS
jgi:hypothetical protein